MLLNNIYGFIKDPWLFIFWKKKNRCLALQLKCNGIHEGQKLELVKAEHSSSERVSNRKICPTNHRRQPFRIQKHIGVLMSKVSPLSAPFLLSFSHIVDAFFPLTVPDSLLCFLFLSPRLFPTSCL